jgi:DNA-directed RNA polymerase subunit alpha
VGQRTNYDRLILEVWTKGTVLPEDALVEAAKILRKHLNPFVQYHELGEDVVTETVEVGAPPPQNVTPDHMDRMRASLERPVSDLELSVRASNCLGAARIHTIGELVNKTEADLLRVRSFGKTSLREVKKKLADMGLSLGMAFGEGGELDAAVMPDDDETEGAGEAGIPEQVGNMNG